MLAPGHGIDVNGVDDARKGDNVRCRVLVVGLVEGKTLGPQDDPDLLPLAHAPFGLEHIEPAVVDDALIVGCGADVALLAEVALLMRGLGKRVDRGLEVAVGEVEVGDGAAFAARVVEGLRGPSGTMHLLWGYGARGPGLGLGRARHNIVSGGPAKTGKLEPSGRRGHDGQFCLFGTYSCLCPYEVHPLLRVLVGHGAEVVVAGGREDAEDVFHLLLRVSLARDGRDLGEVDLVSQFRLVLVLVDGEAVWAQDGVDGLPGLSGCQHMSDGRAKLREACLCLARALHHRAGLDDAVELEAAVLVDGRHDVDAGAGGFCVVQAGRIQLHASRADGGRVGGRGLRVQCRCHAGGGRCHIHSRRGGQAVWAQPATGGGAMRALATVVIFRLAMGRWARW